MEFSEKVKYARKKLNISQERLAKKLGVAFSTVNRWEKSHTLPSYETMKKFEDLCIENNITFED